jgi:hypothetical protein
MPTLERHLGAPRAARGRARSSTRTAAEPPLFRELRTLLSIDTALRSMRGTLHNCTVARLTRYVRCHQHEGDTVTMTTHWNLRNAAERACGLWPRLRLSLRAWFWLTGMQNGRIAAGMASWITPSSGCTATPANAVGPATSQRQVIPTRVDQPANSASR